MLPNFTVKPKKKDKEVFYKLDSKSFRSLKNQITFLDQLNVFLRQMIANKHWIGFYKNLD